jgi:hypothetical protein
MAVMPARTLTWPRLERYRSLARTTAMVAGVTLVAFHGWLFASQLAAGALADPGLVFRWLAAAGVVAALTMVRRRGMSLWSRPGVAVWVLAALLHGPAVASDIGADAIALPETVASAVQQLISVSALAITLWMLAGLLARREHRASAGFVVSPSLAGMSGDGFSPPYSSRPPPRRR